MSRLVADDSMVPVIDFPNEVKAGSTTGFEQSDATGDFASKLNLFNSIVKTGETGTTKFSSSYGPYYRNMIRKAAHSNKYASLTQSDEGVGGRGGSTLTPNLTDERFQEDYRYETVKLLSICPELKYLG
tara:strand:+ start:333 stop:719 length:387 start_codon:yes stop_codon:yes gene_type:complete